MSKILALVLVAISIVPAMTIVSTRQANAVTSSVKVEARLPKSVVPTNYRLTIEPDFAKGTFSGKEKIAINVLAPTQSIVINSVNLTIESAAVKRSSREFLAHRKHIIPNTIKSTVVAEPASEQLKVVLPEKIYPGSYELDLNFNGKFDEQLRGFYLANYKDETGAKQSVACTQMEPTDARRMFPCFDEPVYKATYSINCVIDSNLTAISNSPIAKEELNPDTHKKTVVFEQTPKMSSYLVALVIGNFASTEVKEANKIPIRIWAIKGKESMGSYALETAAKLLPYMNQYFGIRYPAKKLDLIAIPDFGPGAMENLGAITFKETALLVDDKTASASAKQVVAEVIAHEMAHQWFGDLVTTRWWDDIWLNEAFASWMGTKSCDFLRPDWRLWDGFGRSALSVDSLKSTRSIHADVKSPEEAMQMFDDITYVKGSAVLRMLERYVGQDVFMRGVQLYMKLHAFKTATTNDLWEAIAIASAKPIPEMMKTWIYQPGYPLVSTQANSSTTAGGKDLQLSQERYFLDPPAKLPDTKWMLPVALKWLSVSGNTESMHMMEQAKVNVPYPAGEPIALVNSDSQGFYRVSYSKELLNKLVPTLYKGMNASERLALLSDMSSLVWSNRQPIGESLRLTVLCKNEQDPLVIPTIVGRVVALKRFVAEALQPNYQQYVQSMLVPQKTRLTWQVKAEDSDLTIEARNSVLATLGTYGQHQPTISEARELFKKYRDNEASLNPNLIGPVLAIVAYNGGPTEYEQIKALWKSAKTPEAEKRNLMVLSGFQSLPLIQKTLTLALSDEVRKQDCPRLLSHLINNDKGKNVAWAFVKLHWSDIVRKCTPMALEGVVDGCRRFDTAADEANLKAFFATHMTPYIKTEVARMLEDVHLSVRYRLKNAPLINNWIRDKQWQ